MILDEHGRSIRTNDVAGRLLQARDGLYLSEGALHAHCPVENRRFRKILEGAAQAHALAAPRSEVTTLSRPAAPTPLSVLVRPIPLSYRTEDKSRRPAVAVFIRDPAGSPRNPHANLRKLFHLTPTEIELALLMVDGLTLDEAAMRLGVKKNTVRAHLRGIFAKTGATRQAVLVKMLLSSVVGMGVRGEAVAGYRYPARKAAPAGWYPKHTLARCASRVPGAVRAARFAHGRWRS